MHTGVIPLSFAGLDIGTVLPNPRSENVIGALGTFFPTNPKYIGLSLTNLNVYGSFSVKYLGHTSKTMTLTASVPGGSAFVGGRVGYILSNWGKLYEITLI